MSPLERASWLRHLSIVVAVGLAWSMRRQFAAPTHVLGVIGLFAALNLATVFFTATSRWQNVVWWLSAIIAITCWTSLAALTGGSSSPFIGGLWLEVVFTGMVLSVTRALLVTAGAVASLVICCYTLEPGPLYRQRLLVQAGFLAASGAVLFFVVGRWAQRERALSTEAEALDVRLRTLSSELSEARRLGQLGEGVARLAHGLRNVVHSLRGFTKLAERHLTAAASANDIIKGLGAAIDRLEEITARTLRAESETETAPVIPTSAMDVDRTLDEVIREVGAEYPGIQWVKVRARASAGVAIAPELLREIVLVLAENAAEASGGVGDVILEVSRFHGMLSLMVQDRGPGIDAAELFRLGATTKSSGHGFGLFLARRLVESKGGKLTAAGALGGGARFTVTLPVHEN
jgi:signal transduction histidine kinase